MREVWGQRGLQAISFGRKTGEKQAAAEGGCRKFETSSPPRSGFWRESAVSIEGIERTYTLIYRIDVGGRITYVNPVWNDFALKNQGEAVLPERVLGTKLLAAVADRTVRELYLWMIRRAREGVPARFCYRCDAPDRRRTFEMNIYLVANGQVEFASTLLHEEPRPAVALLETGAQREERMLRVCSWCQKVALPDGAWVPVEEAVNALHLMEAERVPLITHGICDACKAEMKASIGLK